MFNRYYFKDISTPVIKSVRDKLSEFNRWASDNEIYTEDNGNITGFTEDTYVKMQEIITKVKQEFKTPEQIVLENNTQDLSWEHIFNKSNCGDTVQNLSWDQIFSSSTGGTISTIRRVDSSEM